MSVPIAMSLTYDCAYGNNCGCTYWLCLLNVFEFEFACLLTDNMALSCKFAYCFRYNCAFGCAYSNNRGWVMAAIFGYACYMILNLSAI
jgi:hypothetical protein